MLVIRVMFGVWYFRIEGLFLRIGDAGGIFGAINFLNISLDPAE